MAKVDGRSVSYYPIVDQLRGFEMLVVSSNNMAVENVTKELPGAGAIAEDATDLRYFKSISDELLDSETWGMMAAVLGSAKRREEFLKVFWWDKEASIRVYLDRACGATSRGRKSTAHPSERSQKFIEEEDPPSNESEAQKRWQEARKQFLEAWKASETSASLFQSISNYIRCEETRRLESKRTAERGKAHRSSRPGWLARLLRTQSYRNWWCEGQQIEQDQNKVEKDYEKVSGKFGTDVQAASKFGAFILSSKVDPLGDEAHQIAAFKELLTGRIMDETFGRAGHSDQQMWTPWFDDRAHRVRDEVFVKAMHLHKAFIGAAAGRLRSNLNLLVDVLNGKSVKFLDDDGKFVKDYGLAQLWASLFLFTPVVSSTLASVGRMLGGLPPESLGWLLIDESGQAVPQSAVGALMRTRRAVIVGDPLQIEPVVTFPDGLTPKVFEHFGVDAEPFNAPAASVQTLADSAGPFCGKLGSSDVGIPLLVHRRCQDPMFSISNQVAYADLMVTGVVPAGSKIANVLGRSCWFDVRGQGSGDGQKWCKEEGEKVVDLLRQLKDVEKPIDVFIITPFRVVLEGLRNHVRDSGVLKEFDLEDEAANDWRANRIGTVHTFQGREAECVIFVLGAPEEEQRGTRKWAGGTPNLLNVAVSRAKRVLYVVGNRDLWKTAGCFQELDEML